MGVVEPQPTLVIPGQLWFRDLRGSLSNSGAWVKQGPSDIITIVIHHTAVDGDQSAESIAAFHVGVRGWPGIGYHFLVHPGGDVDYVGDITTVRAHVAGRNFGTVGIALIGDFTSSEPWPSQIVGTKHLMAWLRAQLPATPEIVGHRDYALPDYPTSCPGDTWEGWKQMF